MGDVFGLQKRYNDPIMFRSKFSGLPSIEIFKCIWAPTSHYSVVNSLSQGLRYSVQKGYNQLLKQYAHLLHESERDLFPQEPFIWSKYCCAI
jgi:hypothetical protein